MCIMVLHLERVYDVRCALCESREEKRNSKTCAEIKKLTILEHPVTHVYYGSMYI
jgi:hypothetical protein